MLERPSYIEYVHGAGRHQIPTVTERLYSSGLGRVRSYHHASLVLEKCIEILNSFVGEMRNLLFNMPAKIKARDPFVQIRKKIGLVVNLEATSQ